ncbi:hypothetical protein CAPTEDRAFT_210239 [Capitella teleta]|uniref:Uncharacterized protein n=1 Tax=Capitella teleta TaxID=283909 RepID=R7VBI8_CAPTE|nr:hypothetical protein CAPTEDRAFT_210239 [Capitella teleta]|eukprot:ELU15932.1 hypothetical protein CAPTEDRAFT_210239 [Capitella teleta]
MNSQHQEEEEVEVEVEEVDAAADPGQEELAVVNQFADIAFEFSRRVFSDERIRLETREEETVTMVMARGTHNTHTIPCTRTTTYAQVWHLFLEVNKTSMF